jgi:hypothetical protein
LIGGEKSFNTGLYYNKEPEEITADYEVVNRKFIDGSIDAAKADAAEAARALLPDYMLTNMDVAVTNAVVSVDATWYYTDTKQSQTYQKALPFASPDQPGLMTAAYAESLTEIVSDIATLKSKGGTRKGTFDTYADFQNAMLPVPTLVNVEDYIVVLADETQDGSKTEYYCVDNGSGKEWQYGGVIEYGVVGIATTETVGTTLGTPDIAPESGQTFGANDGAGFVEPDGSIWVIGWGRLVALVGTISGAVSTITAQIASLFNVTTGHEHNGTDSKKISYTNITGSIPGTVTTTTKAPETTVDNTLATTANAVEAAKRFYTNALSVLNIELLSWTSTNAVVKVTGPGARLVGVTITPPTKAGTTTSMNSGTPSPYTATGEFTLAPDDVLFYRPSLSAWCTAHRGYTMLPEDYLIGWNTGAAVFMCGSGKGLRVGQKITYGIVDRMLKTGTLTPSTGAVFAASTIRETDDLIVLHFRFTASAAFAADAVLATWDGVSSLPSGQYGYCAIQQQAGTVSYSGWIGANTFCPGVALPAGTYWGSVVWAKS